MKNVFLHPGDKVIITKYTPGIYYRAGFVYGMRKYCGQVMTIESIGYFDTIPERMLYYLKEDLEGYIWSIDMFEKLPLDELFIDIDLIV